MTSFPKSNEELLEVCIGCGLCCGSKGFDMRIDDQGFMKPEFAEDFDFNEIASYCPSMNQPRCWPDSIWGDYLELYVGWAKNKLIRFQASSGGVTTSLLMYLFESDMIDSAICVQASPDDPAGACGVICESAEEVAECCGSRYVACAPMLPLCDLLGCDERFAVVGRPCDIRGARMFFENNPRLGNKCIAALSFFCAGIPSRKAVTRLLADLGTADKELSSFRYRGHGWPGKATAVSSSGKISEASYEESWGSILGRDINPYCRFCFDGVGDCADISMGDAWLVNVNGTSPDFSEHPGRNLVFARTETGLSILQNSVAAGFVELGSLEDDGYLECIQKYQASRRGLLYYRTLALKLFGKRFQTAPLAWSRKYKDSISKYDALRVFIGTIKRLVTGKIEVY